MPQMDWGKRDGAAMPPRSPAIAPPRRGRAVVLLGLAAWVVLSAGCATYTDRLHEVRTAFYAGDLAGAEAAIEKHLSRRSEADVLKLERAIVQLCDGRAQEAEQTLREVRDRLDYLEQKDAGEAALVMLSDDTARGYAGEDYEKVLVRAFLALANLMHDGGDAGAYALQVTDKQNQSGADPECENPKLAYQRVALGAYVCGALQEESQLNYDDARRSWAKVCSWQPDFSSGRRDLQRAAHGHHSAPGNGVLYVFTLVGRGPYKEEVIELPSTVSLLIADRIISHNAEHSLPPNIAPIKVPKVTASPNRVRSVRVSVDGQPAGATETITDVASLAVAQYEAVYPQILARAIVRRVVKKGAIYGVKEVVEADNNTWLNLAMDAGGVLWEATEKADTRCWGLLPDRIQVLRLELPAGQHRLGLQAAGNHSPRGVEHPTTVTIDDGRNTYVLACFPDAKLVGRILSSGG